MKRNKVMSDGVMNIEPLITHHSITHYLLFPLLLLFLLSACTPRIESARAANATPQTTALVLKPLEPTALPTNAPTASALPATPMPSPSPRPTLSPDAWKNLPVIPTISETARVIYRRGQELGTNPRAFSKVGDCESTSWFLSDFDNGPRFYDLGPYTDLLPVIDQFSGSWKRISLAVRPGFNATSVLTPLWADPKLCNKDETPLACEYRQQRPAFAFITLGSNNAAHLESFEPQMRRILDYTIEQGIVPILATKADNLEGDNRINATIAQLANEYDIPLWNWWRAAQDLPNGGLQDDNAHLTFGPNRFGDPTAMRRAWPWRNLTALQVMDAVWRGAEK